MQRQNRTRMQHNYKFYPTLLDAFVYYLGSESETAEQELIDKINRVPFKSDAADKGTWFNNLIDASITLWDRFNLCYVDGIAAELVEYLQGSQMQLYTETTIIVDGAHVLLYGYIDYVKQYKALDLKTTREYSLGKYQKSIQRHLYPVYLIDRGANITEFEFVVTDFNGVYKESYSVDYNSSKLELHNVCRDFIAFLESKRNLITDKKIFGELLTEKK